MAAGQETASESSKLIMELPSFLDAFIDVHHHEIMGLPMHHWVPVFFSVLVGAILLGITYFATRDLKKIPQGMQAFLEVIIKGMQGFFGEILGPVSSIFLPFVGSLFLYILIMNLIGLVPFFHSPTSSPNTTIALAVIVFFVTHYVGVTRNGIIGYLKHFVSEPIWMTPFLFPIHIIGEFARPLSLSMRLFGNIMGEDTAIAILVGLGVAYYIPLQFPVQALAVLMSLIQASVFSILASIYIAGAAGGHEK